MVTLRLLLYLPISSSVESNVATYPDITSLSLESDGPSNTVIADTHTVTLRPLQRLPIELLAHILAFGSSLKSGPFFRNFHDPESYHITIESVCWMEGCLPLNAHTMDTPHRLYAYRGVPRSVLSLLKYVGWEACSLGRLRRGRLPLSS